MHERNKQLKETEDKLNQERESAKAIAAETERVKTLAEQALIEQQRHHIEQTRQLEQRVAEAELSRGRVQSVAAQFEGFAIENKLYSNDSQAFSAKLKT